MRIVRVSVACIFIIITAWAFGADEEPQNLVTNPDFSNGNTGWAFYAGNGAGTWEITTKGGVGDDGPCVFIEVVALDGVNWYQPNLYSSGLVVLDNDEYTLSLWARTEEEMDRDITVTIQRGADPWTRFTQESFTINGEWNEYWMTWAQPEALDNCWIMIHPAGSNAGVSKGLLWIDHIRLYEGEFVEDALSQGEDPVKAVKPTGKLAVTWGEIK